jgi:DNA-binding transcriptional ArsR family regulator
MDTYTPQDGPGVPPDPADAGRVFAALANPVRRELLELLLEGPSTAGDLAGAFEISRSAVSEHLGVLRRAGLVREEPSGRHRRYHLEVATLGSVGAWLHPFERYWQERLHDLGDVLDEEEATP